MSKEGAHFRLCSSCRRPLDFGARYYVCSVSTCNRTKMPLTFCSLPCFEAHVPGLRHREAWAEERLAPKYETWEAERLAREEQERFERTDSNRGPGLIARAPSVGRPAAPATGWKPAASKELTMSNEVPNETPREVLVVISKVKSYIRAKSGMNTSDAVTEALSELVRSTCDQAVERAKSEGRKTVMARDIGTGASE
jgi:hypothetical protein